jgi:hypothetical protein
LGARRERCAQRRRCHDGRTKEHYVPRSHSWKSRFGFAVATAALVASLTAGIALAGEVTGPPGKGGHTPIGAAPDTDPHAHSICSFSGLGDGEDAPGRTAAHVQNWGQIPKVQRDAMSLIGFHPGDSCNGHSGFFSGAGGE